MIFSPETDSDQQRIRPSSIACLDTASPHNCFSCCPSYPKQRPDKTLTRTICCMRSSSLTASYRLLPTDLDLLGTLNPSVVLHKRPRNKNQSHHGYMRPVVQGKSDGIQQRHRQNKPFLLSSRTVDNGVKGQQRPSCERLPQQDRTRVFPEDLQKDCASRDLVHSPPLLQGGTTEPPKQQNFPTYFRW